MTIHIQMLQDIATHARAMADSMPSTVQYPSQRCHSRRFYGEYGCAARFSLSSEAGRLPCFPRNPSACWQAA